MEKQEPGFKTKDFGVEGHRFFALAVKTQKWDNHKRPP
jgi:hypothetical protein